MHCASLVCPVDVLIARLVGLATVLVDQYGAINNRGPERIHLLSIVRRLQFVELRSLVGELRGQVVSLGRVRRKIE